MAEKITNFIMKLVFYPVIFLLLYSGIIVLSSKIIIYNNLNNDIKSLVLVFICASIISFIITAVINTIFILLKGKDIGKRTFKNWFEWSHLILIYISGLVSLLYTLEPMLLEEKVIQASLGKEAYWGWIMGFFMAVSNYYFYKAFVTSEDIELPYIKEVFRKLKKVLANLK